MNGDDSNRNICRIIVECGCVRDVPPLRLHIYIDRDNVCVDNQHVDGVDAGNLVATFDVAGLRFKVVNEVSNVDHLRREDARFHRALILGLLSNASIEEMADICCLSISTFKRHFRKRYSAAPHDWFLQQRLHIAYQLILASDLQVCELASLCGFRNVSHFIAQFRRHYDITPSRLRHSFPHGEGDIKDATSIDVVVDIDV